MITTACTRRILVALVMATVAVTGGCQCEPPVSSTGRAAEAEPEANAGLATDDAVRAAYAEATGRTLDDRACIARPSAFDAVVVVGRHLEAQGCAPMGMFVDGQWVVGDIAVRRGLATRGWLEATPKMREQLAWDWTQTVVFAFGPEPLTEPPLGADGAAALPEFEPPARETDRDGATLVTVWVAESNPGAAVDPEADAEGPTGWAKQRLRFAPDGSLTTRRLARSPKPAPAPTPDPRRAPAAQGEATSHAGG